MKWNIREFISKQVSENSSDAISFIKKKLYLNHNRILLIEQLNIK